MTAAALLCGCPRMRRQAKLKPLEPSALFPDGRCSRPLVEGTVPADASLDEELMTGRRAKTFSPEFPFAVDRAVIERGRVVFERHCAACHDRTGGGDGIVVQNGFPKPLPYADDTVLESPPGFFVLVIGEGFGRMASYAARVKPADRWAVAAYIRALQLAAHAPVKDLPAKDRAALEALR